MTCITTFKRVGSKKIFHLRKNILSYYDQLLLITIIHKKILMVMLNGDGDITANKPLIAKYKPQWDKWYEKHKEFLRKR